ncbi:hypothetical protein AALP_AA4G090200 [Arabis alpina]|uniref:Uncharacterized protein n=1 Tax=Arabis alpina TaxID=50452 RepID=A0A087H242_ARAAL|nr:hypothetical protein AALP_AA4G090200 [Arabis alpina]
MFVFSPTKCCKLVPMDVFPPPSSAPTNQTNRLNLFTLRRWWIRPKLLNPLRPPEPPDPPDPPDLLYPSPPPSPFPILGSFSSATPLPVIYSLTVNLVLEIDSFVSTEVDMPDSPPSSRKDTYPSIPAPPTWIGYFPVPLQTLTGFLPGRCVSPLKGSYHEVITKPLLHHVSNQLWAWSNKIFGIYGPIRSSFHGSLSSQQKSYSDDEFYCILAENFVSVYTRMTIFPHSSLVERPSSPSSSTKKRTIPPSSRVVLSSSLFIRVVESPSFMPGTIKSHGKVTIQRLSGFAAKSPLTHPKHVLDSLSIFRDEISILVLIKYQLCCIMLRGCLIPSFVWFDK